MYVERAAQLQKALYSLQSANDRREETERKLRLQLEMELQRAKAFPGNFEYTLFVSELTSVTYYIMYI